MCRFVFSEYIAGTKLWPILRIKPVLVVLFILSLSYSCNRHNSSNNDHSVVINKITDSANRLVDRQDLDIALKYFDKHFALINNPGTRDEWKRYYFKQEAYYNDARLTKNESELKLSSTYADSMLLVIRDQQTNKVYQNEQRLSDFAKGDVLFELEEYNKAYSFFYDGKLLSANACDNASFDSRFALLNYRERKYKEAASLFMQAYHDELGCTLDFETFASTQGALDNAGLSYENENMVDSAIACYKKALAYIDLHANRFPEKKRFATDARGVTYGYLGMINQDRGNMAEAEKWFKMSIRLNSDAGNERRNTQIIQLKLARTYLGTAQMVECDSMINVIRASLDTLPNERAELDWEKLKWQFLYANRQSQKAGPYLLTYLKLLDKEDANERKLAAADARGSFQHFQENYELTILKKEDELRFLYLVITLGFSGLVLINFFQIWRNWRISKKSNEEITERNLNLQKALDSLEQSQNENTYIMNIVAHDLRSPIGGMTMAASKLLDEPNRTEKDRSLLNLIKTSGKNSLTLVSDLLQVHARAGELKKDPVDMYTLLRYCVDLLRLKADEKQQKIVLDAGHFTLDVNREKMWRVLSNLITNAIKFSPNGATISVLMLKKEDFVQITVDDYGIGIPEYMREKIFDMFTGSKRTGTMGEQSFGIGLAISKQIVEAHGGRLWFESKPANGTLFHVELPLKIRDV